NARLPQLLIRHEDVVEAAIGQLHDDDQLALDDLDAVDRQDERMADGLDEVERPQLLLGAVGVGVQSLGGIAGDELDGLEEVAGRNALPDLAEAALTKRFDQAVAGER